MAYYLHMKSDVTVWLALILLILFLLSIGTSIGGNDVVAFFDVGVVNHKAISGLTLHSGHSYYATVKGIYNHCIFNSWIMNFE